MIQVRSASSLEAAIKAALKDNSSRTITEAQRTFTLTTNTLLPQAELTFRSAVAGYENGQVDFATLIDAQRQIRPAKQTRSKAQAEAPSRLGAVGRLR